MSTPTKILATQQVQVRRDLQTITAEVFAHEIPILEKIHNYENVTTLVADYGELEIPDDAELEMRRLVGKYDQKRSKNVEHVYRNARELSRASGLAMPEVLAERPSQAGIRVNNKVVKSPTSVKPSRASAKAAEKASATG